MQSNVKRRKATHSKAKQHCVKLCTESNASQHWSSLNSSCAAKPGAYLRSASKPSASVHMMAVRAQRSDRIAEIPAAIEARKKKIAKRKAYSRSSGNAHARFQSFEAADLERKRARLGMRKLRSKRSHASAQPARKQCSAAKPATKRQRHIPRNCCGRRPENCKCFKHGRGLEIAKSNNRRKIT